MAKVKNLGLYVGLLCIIGILTVFSFDAYIGIYDVLYTEQDGWEREIAFDEPHIQNNISGHVMERRLTSAMKLSIMDSKNTVHILKRLSGEIKKRS